MALPFECKKLNKKELYQILWRSMESAGFKFIQMTKLPKAVKVETHSPHNGPVTFLIVIKNLCDSGWKDKPWIKRIQVYNLGGVADGYLKPMTEHNVSLLLGFGVVDSKPVFCAWNCYRYQYHATLRSCYVHDDILSKAQEDGYAYSVDSSQDVWVFTPENFGIFFDNYLKVFVGEHR
jgi:hypothetical protein